MCEMATNLMQYVGFMPQCPCELHYTFHKVKRSSF